MKKIVISLLLTLFSICAVFSQDLEYKLNKRTAKYDLVRSENWLQGVIDRVKTLKKGDIDSISSEVGTGILKVEAGGKLTTAISGVDYVTKEYIIKKGDIDSISSEVGTGVLKVGAGGKLTIDDRFFISGIGNSNMVAYFKSNFEIKSTPTMLLDHNHNRVGIGCKTPWVSKYKLEVNGDIGVKKLYINDVEFKKQNIDSLTTSLNTGLLKIEGGTGKLSNAIAGVDYLAPTSNNITGSGTATYIPMFSGSNVLSNSPLRVNNTSIMMSSVSGNIQSSRFSTFFGNTGDMQIFTRSPTAPVLIGYANTTNTSLTTEIARFQNGRLLIGGGLTTPLFRLQLNGTGQTNGIKLGTTTGTSSIGTIYTTSGSDLVLNGNVIINNNNPKHVEFTNQNGELYINTNGNFDFQEAVGLSKEHDEFIAGFDYYYNEYLFGNGKLRIPTWSRSGVIIESLQGSLTDDAPTLSQINAIVGRTATSAGRGYQVTIFDTDGSKKAYHIVSDGANWHYTVMTKAL